MKSFRMGALIVCLLLAGCPGRNEWAGMSDSTFVDVMARLHRIETDDRLSREERDSLRRVVLQEEELTPEQLEAAARMLATDAQRAQDVWQAIERKSGEPATAPETPVRRARPEPEAPPQDTVPRGEPVPMRGSEPVVAPTPTP